MKTLYQAIGLFALAIWAVMQDTVSAHPGHGATVLDGNSAAHYLIEPLHLLPVLATGAVVVGAIYFLVAKWNSRQGS